MKTETKVFEGNATHHRFAYLKLIDNKVIFDCSNEEYGPIEFDIDLLADALDTHANKCITAIVQLIKNE